MRAQLDLTSRIKVTATMKFLTTLCSQRVSIADSRVVTVSPLSAMCLDCLSVFTANTQHFLWCWKIASRGNWDGMSLLFCVEYERHTGVLVNPMMHTRIPCLNHTFTI